DHRKPDPSGAGRVREPSGVGARALRIDRHRDERDDLAHERNGDAADRRQSARTRAPHLSGGWALAEALVAAALVAVVAGSAATRPAPCGRLPPAARRGAGGGGGALDRAGALRAGPRGDGTDVLFAGGPVSARRWTNAAGRGDADALAVAVDWGGHEVTL